MLDTGAAISLLSSGLVASLEMRGEEVMAAGDRLKVGISRLASLAVGAASLSNVQVAVTDLSEMARKLERV